MGHIEIVILFEMGKISPNQSTYWLDKQEEQGVQWGKHEIGGHGEVMTLIVG